MRTGRPTRPLDVSADEREKLEAWARRARSEQRLALRARIVLGCAGGGANQDVAARLGVTGQTVCKWRERFRVKRLEGLADEPRPGAPRSLSDAKVGEVVSRTLETMPSAGTHWSIRRMAKATGLSRDAVHRIWRAFGLKPHLVETFKLSRDPFFAEKVRDIAGLYLHPPERAIVLCVDEKAQVQALQRTQPLLPLRPGQPERRTHDYTRHGVTSLFAALDVATGQVMGQCQRRHRHQEFLKFLGAVEDAVPEGLAVHLVMDNYATHKTPRIRRWLHRRPHWHVHFTPTGASWLNQVERFFAQISERRIRRGSFMSVAQLEEAIMDYLDHHNRESRPFVWTATPEKILKRVERFCERITQTPH